MLGSIRACICPALTDYLADEARKDTAVMKEMRKAREERNLAKPKKDAKKGKDGPD